MTLLQFLTAYLLLIFSGSAFIVGWYIITRGERVVQPDGSIKAYGKIFRGWSLFWEATTGIKKIYYNGDRLSEKYNHLLYVRPKVGKKLQVNLEGMSLQVVHGESLTMEDRKAIEDVLGCETKLNGDYLFLYNQENEYRFPELVRMPISQCPPCMASVYGSFIWWSFVWLQHDAFSWTFKENFAKIFFWIIFCVILSCFNKIVYRKTDF